MEAAQTLDTAGPPRRAARPGAPVVDPACWTGAELAARGDWVDHLSGEEIDGLRRMVERVHARVGDDPAALLSLDRPAFDLGGFAARMAAMRHELKDGRGFVQLRGLPVDDWSRLEAAIAYWGIGRHLGRALPNNALGDMIGHVRDLGADYGESTVRGYEVKAALGFHVDQCDMVALLCLQKARAGGLSRLASAVAVHNELLHRRPDQARALADPYCWSRHGERQADQEPWHLSPVFNYLDDHFSATLGHMHVLKGHAHPGAPPLSDARKAAVFAAEEIAAELCLDIEFEPGDVQILNNAVIFHSRTAIEDWPEPARRRHLWRLWFNVPELRPRSPYFENFIDGIPTPGRSPRIRLTPELE